ncbi:DMT family transporter [Nitrincola sp. MINF-07-Sa-05]|uniref:DMT family transporter n=1 Tax=Nitrincola salilacus TaxID=3400273 RepID=UPI00391818F9
MRTLTIIAFITLGVIWGSNFIFMKWAAEVITPSQTTLLRVLFGFLPLFGFALCIKALKWADLRHWYHFVVMSLLATAVYYLAFAKGTALLPSSVAGMLSGSIPLFTFLAALIFLRDEPINRSSMSGTVLGFIGVLIIAQPWNSSGSVSIEGVLYMLGGALCVGVSFVYAKIFIKPLEIAPLALATYQTGFATILLFATTETSNISFILGDLKALIAMVIGLGILGTGLAYIIYYFLVNQMGAIAASGVTYIPPIVALLIGFTLVGEDIRSSDLLAVVLILTGVWLVQRARIQMEKAPLSATRCSESRV